MIEEAGMAEVRAGAMDAPGKDRDHAPSRDAGIIHSTHLLRELIAADARSEAAGESPAERADALLHVVLSGLELAAGAIVQPDAAGGAGMCLAVHGIPDYARELLEARLPHLESLGGSLVQRALAEHHVLLLDRSSRDPLMPALRDASPDVEHAAVVPLTDHGVPVGVLVLVARSGRLSSPLLRSLAIAFRLLAVLLAPGRGVVTAERSEDPAQGAADSERYLFEIEELTQRLEEARAAGRQREERASSADAALRAELESARARSAEVEAELASALPRGDRALALEETCAAQADTIAAQGRTIAERERRIAELAEELRVLLERGAALGADAGGDSGNGATSWDEDALAAAGSMAGDEEGDAPTIALEDAGDVQLGDIAAAAAAALGDGNGGEVDAASADGGAVLSPEVGIEAVVTELAAEADARTQVEVALLHVESRAAARELARQSAEAMGVAYWCGDGELPDAARAIVAVNLLDDDLARAVDADPRLWSASRWIVYGADAETGMGFELGSCALLRRPIDPRCCLEQIQHKVGRKLSGLLLVTAQLREVAALRQALQEIDAAGSVACDTRQALDLLEIVRRPDAVLIDLALPHGQGLALASQLRRQPETASLPLLLLLPPVVDTRILRAEADRAQLLGPFVAEDVHRLVRATLAGRA